MVRRPRTPHFITGIGDGNVNLDDGRANGGVRHRNSNVRLNDDLYSGKAGASAQQHDGHHHHNVRTRNERLVRMEDPPMTVDHWNDVFGNADSTGDVDATGCRYCWIWILLDVDMLGLAAAGCGCWWYVCECA